MFLIVELLIVSPKIISKALICIGNSLRTFKIDTQRESIKSPKIIATLLYVKLIIFAVAIALLSNTKKIYRIYNKLQISSLPLQVFQKLEYPM